MTRAQPIRATVSAAAVATVLAFAPAACGSSSGGTPAARTGPSASMDRVSAGAVSPGTVPPGAGAAGTASARLGDLHLTGGYIPQPASPDVAAAYLTITNSGARPDVLSRVTTDVTRSVDAMGETSTGGTGSMTDLPDVTVPAHGSFRFAPGHAHLMLQQPRRPLRQGDRVRMRITFRHAGTVTMTLPVVGFTGPASGASGAAMTGMSMGGH